MPCACRSLHDFSTPCSRRFVSTALLIIEAGASVPTRFRASFRRGKRLISRPGRVAAGLLTAGGRPSPRASRARDPHRARLPRRWR